MSEPVGRGTWSLLRPVTLLARWDGAAVLAVMVLVGSLIYAAGALKTDYRSVEANQFPYLVSQSSPFTRHITATQFTSVASLSALTNEGGRIAAEELHPEVAALVADRRVEMEAPQVGMTSPTTPTGELLRTFNFRVQPTARDHLALVEGSWPRPKVGTEPLEVALSSASASATEVGVGDVVEVRLTGDGRRLFLAGRRAMPFEVVVTGLFEGVDRDERFWGGDIALLDPAVSFDANLNKLVDVTALVDDGSLAAVEAVGLGVIEPRVTWRFLVDPGRYDPAGRDALSLGFARLSELSHPAGDGLLIQSGLPNIFTRAEADLEATRSFLLVAGISAALAALAAILVLARFLAERRRHTTELARDRGANGLQITTSTAATLALSALAGTLAAIVADRLTALDGLSAWQAGAIAFLVTLIVAIVTVWWDAPRATGRLERVGRAAVEVGVVALAVVVAILLARRRAEPLGRFDVLLALAPPLLALAAALVLGRLYSLVAPSLAAAARRGRGLVAALVLRRFSRDRQGLALPVVVVLVVTTATYAFVFETTLRTEQERTGWRTVGADLMIESDAVATIVEEAGLESMAEVGETTLAYAENVKVLGQARDVGFLAADLDALSRIGSGSPIPVPLPSRGARLSALVSPGVGEPGDVIALILGGQRVMVEVEGVVDEFPSVQAPFVVTFLDEAIRAAPLIEQRLDRLYLDLTPDAPVDGDVAIAELVEGVESRASVTVRRGVDADLSASPFSAAVPGGFRTVSVVSLIFGVATILLVALLTGSRRANEAAHLDLIGVPRPSMSALVTLELVVPVVPATLAGVLAGIVAVRLGVEASALARLTGAPGRVGPTVDPLGLLVAPAVLVIVAVVVAVVAGRRLGAADAVEALRSEVR